MCMERRRGKCVGFVYLRVIFYFVSLDGFHSFVFSMLISDFLIDFTSHVSHSIK